ncbi:Golgin subfamily A member 1 [Elysia marginata]|uniref:Golgin subfamily A member 1 n=1 Tax=Elysia marginata TaxID=1093978 RepID=A0AAV4GCZ7_9GAST|nr:Golgin subfamily A member 1 [Elysia marginata]
MFAKLKKKIETDDAASPGRIGRAESVTSLPRAGSTQFLGPSPPCSATSENPSMKDVTVSNDETARLLLRKTEQCKKLEGNISGKCDEKNELKASLREAESYKSRFFKKEEENDEFEDLATQELAKVKHLLINTEEALTACRAELEGKTRQCQAAETQVEKLTDELGPLKQKLSSIEAENVKLKEEVNERSDVIMMLTKEKAAFDRRLDELNSDMTKKLSEISRLEEQLSDLDNEHKTLLRNSDIQRNKSSKLLEEKDEHIETLQERVRTLEQRVSNSTLSGDDKTAALEAERTKLEEKLSEARQQLTEVKSTWSDKITHLEHQIQILEHEINTQKLKAMDNETQLRAKISLLESELTEMEKARQAEASEAKSKVAHFEGESARFLEKELKLEEQSRVLDAKISKLQEEITKKDEEIASLKQQVRELQSAQEHMSSLEGSVAEAEKRRDEFETHLRGSESEKEKLLERNADLLQQIQCLKSSHADSKKELQRVIDLKTQTIEALQKAEVAMRQRLDGLERQIDQNEIVKVESGLYSERIDEMSATIATQQAQLTEKNRLLKKQEQTLKDLRLTLQRELKVQALPNDEAPEPAANSASGGRLEGATGAGRASSPGFYNSSSSSSSSQHQQNHHHLHHQPHSNTNQSNFMQGNSTHPSASQSFHPATSTNPSAAVLAVQSSSAYSSSVVSLTAQSPSVPSGAQDSLTAHTASVKRDLDKDVNFMYLKHVVLKFMLSREAEAIQLIKAVSMLLNFTQQEQQLIKDTLEWKMSWFGHRPPLGKGQKAKVIPPTL